MAAQGEHDRIIKTHAKSVLGPLGFRQKGASRLWIADRGFWVSVVEFQPSGLQKGSYLNVAAHFLWTVQDHVSFDHLLADLRSFIEFENAEQFEPLAAKQARDAAQGSVALQRTFSDLQRAAAFFIEQARKPGAGAWAGFHAAVASALTGRDSAAGPLFAATVRTFEDWRPDLAAGIRDLEAVAQDPVAFRRRIEHVVNARRQALRLAPSVDPLA